MPLSKSGKKLLKKFQKEYGKDKGTSIFYSWENKHKSKLKTSKLINS